LGQGAFQEYKVPQQGEKDPRIRELIRSKLGGVLKKGCLVQGEVKSLTFFFAVPKGEGDVRIVYDGTKSGNVNIWAPWFLLPTVESHLNSVKPDFYMGDINFSEQILNFMLDEKVRKYVGVDVTPFFPTELGNAPRVKWLHWERCGMGLVFSPYNAIQGTLFTDEVIRGDHKDPTNVFRWDFVRLNSASYHPSKSWVCKVCRDGPCSEITPANDMIIYVDDVRTIGQSHAECKLVSRRVASIASYLGLQDAVQKWRDPSVTPGPWAGAIVSTAWSR